MHKPRWGFWKGMLAGVAVEVPALTAHPVDFTGAGDVFASAFLVAYHETGDPRRAARFAHAAAAFAIEDEGTTGIPSRAAVEARLVEQDQRDSLAVSTPPPPTPNPHVR